jgi:hypothetical protein
MSNEQRRRLLKSLAAGGGAFMVGKSLPDAWVTPVIDQVVLPAHAQATLTACQQNPLSLTGSIRWEQPDGDTVGFSINPGFDGAAGTAGVSPTDGSFSGLLFASGGNCANGQPVTQDGTFQGTLNTNDGGVLGTFTHRILCGGIVICTASGSFSGTAQLDTSVAVALSSVVSECCPDQTPVFGT